MKKQIFLLLSLFFCFSLNAYTKSPYIDSQLWQELESYFLPEDHPIKPNLDTIFSASRVSFSSDTLKKAHFHFKKSRTPRNLIAAKHSKLKGYIVKLFTDDQGVCEEWQNWIKRIHGANAIRNAITRHKAEHLLKVPQKWIYPLPVEPSPPPGSHRTHFILIVEDMRILKLSSSLAFWRSIAVDQPLLGALHCIIQEEGLFDSIYPVNIPFCKDRRVAFIDTEHAQEWPIRFYELSPYLRREMQIYWDQLTD